MSHVAAREGQREHEIRTILANFIREVRRNTSADDFDSTRDEQGAGGGDDRRGRRGRADCGGSRDMPAIEGPRDFSPAAAMNQDVGALNLTREEVAANDAMLKELSAQVDDMYRLQEQLDTLEGVEQDTSAQGTAQEMRKTREIEEEIDRKLAAIIDGVQTLSRSVALPPKLAQLLEALPEQVEATRALAEAEDRAVQEASRQVRTGGSDAGPGGERAGGPGHVYGFEGAAAGSSAGGVGVDAGEVRGEVGWGVAAGDGGEGGFDGLFGRDRWQAYKDEIRREWEARDGEGGGATRWLEEDEGDDSGEEDGEEGVGEAAEAGEAGETGGGAQHARRWTYLERYMAEEAAGAPDELQQRRSLFLDACGWLSRNFREHLAQSAAGQVILAGTMPAPRTAAEFAAFADLVAEVQRFDDCRMYVYVHTTAYVVCVYTHAYTYMFVYTCAYTQVQRNATIIHQDLRRVPAANAQVGEAGVSQGLVCTAANLTELDPAEAAEVDPEALEGVDDFGFDAQGNFYPLKGMPEERFDAFLDTVSRQGAEYWVDKMARNAAELHDTGVLREDAWKLEWLDEYGYLVPEALEPGSEFLREHPHILREWVLDSPAPIKWRGDSLNESQVEDIGAVREWDVVHNSDPDTWGNIGNETTLLLHTGMGAVLELRHHSVGPFQFSPARGEQVYYCHLDLQMGRSGGWSDGGELLEFADMNADCFEHKMKTTHMVMGHWRGMVRGPRVVVWNVKAPDGEIHLLEDGFIMLGTAGRSIQVRVEPLLADRHKMYFGTTATMLSQLRLYYNSTTHYHTGARRLPLWTYAPGTDCYERQVRR